MIKIFNKFFLCLVLSFSIATGNANNYVVQVNGELRWNIQQSPIIINTVQVPTAIKVEKVTVANLRAILDSINTQNYGASIEFIKLLLQLQQLPPQQIPLQQPIPQNQLPAIINCCQTLKNHLLTHGHLGYYPEFSYVPENSECVVNQRQARGIFNIPYSIAKRILQEQKRKHQFYNGIIYSYHLPINTNTYQVGYNITEDVHHLLPNIESNIMFHIDPSVAGNNHPNLEDVADGLITQLLDGANVQNVIIGQVSPNYSIPITITYNIPAPYLQYNNFQITQDQNLGYDRNGDLTNTIKLVINVNNHGFIKIISMLSYLIHRLKRSVFIDL